MDQFRRRSLFFYMKNAHRNVIPGLTEFIGEYMSENALAPDGYLAERGLVSLPDADRTLLQEDVLNGKSFGGHGS
jgi:phosphate transport system substrate-binding protein